MEQRVAFTLVEGPAVEMVTIKIDDEYGVLISNLGGDVVGVPWELFPAVLATLESIEDAE